MIESRYTWQESQGYLVFIASSILIYNSEEKKFVCDLLKRHDKGIVWTQKELKRMLDIISTRNRQISSWELDSANIRGTSIDYWSSETYYM
ncbi:MAG: hypothetical protein ACXAEU_23240 [Candidatus Hodarchaeales archaeon]